MSRLAATSEPPPRLAQLVQAGPAVLRGVIVLPDMEDA